MGYRATRIFRKRMAFVFDFDGTLGPGTFEAVLDHCGHEPEEFKSQQVDPMCERHNWEKTLARAYQLSRLGREAGLTEDAMKEIGRNLPLYPGVEEMFDRIRGAAEETLPGVEVEFYLLTAGFATVPKATPIVGQFKQIFSGALHFGEDGRPLAAKRVVTYGQKPRYLLHIARGAEIDSANPDSFTDFIEGEDWHLPLDQMVYVGDGVSDMPAFEMMHERGGIAIGVFEAETAQDWNARDKSNAERRVENLARNDYSEGSELMESLLCAARSLCHRIALREMGSGE